MEKPTVKLTISDYYEGFYLVEHPDRLPRVVNRKRACAAVGKGLLHDPVGEYQVPRKSVIHSDKWEEKRLKNLGETVPFFDKHRKLKDILEESEVIAREIHVRTHKWGKVSLVYGFIPMDLPEHEYQLQIYFRQKQIINIVVSEQVFCTFSAPLTIKKKR